MKKSIRVKKAFTLMEIVLVVILLSSISYFTMSSFNFKTKENYKIKIENIKEFLLKKFEYNQELSLTCIENENLDS